MKYDFTRRERDFGRVVFALTLDRKKINQTSLDKSKSFLYN
jgi:hypothetical protein